MQHGDDRRINEYSNNTGMRLKDIASLFVIVSGLVVSWVNLNNLITRIDITQTNMTATIEAIDTRFIDYIKESAEYRQKTDDSIQELKLRVSSLSFFNSKHHGK